jgi:hypothetical protein
MNVYRGCRRCASHGVDPAFSEPDYWPIKIERPIKSFEELINLAFAITNDAENYPSGINHARTQK